MQIKEEIFKHTLFDAHLQTMLVKLLALILTSIKSKKTKNFSIVQLKVDHSWITKKECFLNGLWKWRQD